MSTVVTSHLTKHTSTQAVQRKWLVLDAKDQILGDVASRAAALLRGKHKPTYTVHTNDGDFVVIINADKVKVTGNKMREKFYYTHSNWPGGIHATRLEDLQRKHPARVLEYAVGGMIRKHRLGRAQIRNLKVYAGETHPHAGATLVPVN